MPLRNGRIMRLLALNFVDSQLLTVHLELGCPSGAAAVIQSDSRLSAWCERSAVFISPVMFDHCNMLDADKMYTFTEALIITAHCMHAGVIIIL